MIEILLMLIIITIPSYFTILKYSEFKKLKDKETNEFLSTVEIRKKGFYEDSEYEKKIMSNLKVVKAKEDSKEKVVKKVKSDKVYYLQIGTFRNRENAENLMKSLEDLASLKLEKSSLNENFYVLLTGDYPQEELKKIEEGIKNRYSSLSPIVKVRY